MLLTFVGRTLRKNKNKGRGLKSLRPPLTSVNGVELLAPPIQCTGANDKSSRMVISPSRTQSITLHMNRRIMQPTLGIRLRISTIEVQEQRSDADSASDLA